MPADKAKQPRAKIADEYTAARCRHNIVASGDEPPIDLAQEKLIEARAAGVSRVALF
jgi:hypothetical protein